MERERDIAVIMEHTSSVLQQRWREQLSEGESTGKEAAELVLELGGALLRAGHEVRLLRTALGYGAAGFRGRRPLCVLLETVDSVERLLLAVTRSASAPAVEEEVWLILRRRSWPVLRAARQGIVSGFTTASERARVRFARRVRHDLKNSVGTIGNALALMGDDDVVPAAPDGRVHEIARRTLGSLDQQIRADLSDDRLLDEGLEPVGAPFAEVAERACRAVAEWRPDRGVSLAGKSLPQTTIDAAASQILIEAILLYGASGTSRADAPDAVELRIDETSTGKVAFRLVASPTPDPDDAGRADWQLIEEIARHTGCTLVGCPSMDGGVRIELTALRRSQAPDDLGSHDERDHL